MKKIYNWWDDPKNKEEVDRISWWKHPENMETFPLSISVINDGEYWTATCNDETAKFLGKKLHGCASGKTKEEAIEKMFLLIRLIHDYTERCSLSYQRFVPFRKGDWGQIGGHWFSIFGIHVYFRHGNNMKGGRYIPFTKLNISVYSEWTVYKNWKSQRKKLNSEQSGAVSDTTESD